MNLQNHFLLSLLLFWGYLERKEFSNCIASNPAGIEFLIDADGTDEEAIERLAYQTKGNFQQSADGYDAILDHPSADKTDHPRTPQSDHLRRSKVTT